MLVKFDLNFQFFHCGLRHVPFPSLILSLVEFGFQHSVFSLGFDTFFSIFDDWAVTWCVTVILCYWLKARTKKANPKFSQQLLRLGFTLLPSFSWNWCSVGSLTKKFPCFWTDCGRGKPRSWLKIPGFNCHWIVGICKFHWTACHKLLLQLSIAITS